MHEAANRGRYGMRQQEELRALTSARAHAVDPYRTATPSDNCALRGRQSLDIPRAEMVEEVDGGACKLF